MKYDEPPVRWRTIAFVPVLLLLIAGTVLINPFSSGAKSKMSTPTIDCGVSTQSSIEIIVTAGATGAPAGFSLQWITAEQYALGPDGIAATGDENTWPASDDTQLCKGSFSGNANLSRYNLAAGEQVTVNVGEFLFDNGASSNCTEALECGTTYVFRAFAHASNSLNRSDFTPNHTCATLACDGGGNEGGCTFTQGYWKTHGPSATGNNENVWPQDVKDNGMDLGTVHYTALQLQSIFDTPAQGNGLVALAHQLIAAKLNIANGADGTDAAQCISAADALIGGLVIPPVGGGSLTSGATSSLTACLTNYNEGASGPGHCN
jgi:hypothetical protein